VSCDIVAIFDGIYSLHVHRGREAALRQPILGDQIAYFDSKSNCMADGELQGGVSLTVDTFGLRQILQDVVDVTAITIVDICDGEKSL
jgi:hypothetical protein